MLKVPPWLQRRSSTCPETGDAWDRGSADGHATPTSPSPKEEPQVVRAQTYANVLPSRCRALYDFQASMDDELSLSKGDVVTVHSRPEEGWWCGELHGSWGLFPASYVEELVDEPG